MTTIGTSEKMREGEEEKTAEEKKMEKEEEDTKEMKREAKSLGMAMIGRLGDESPASLMVCDPMFFRSFVETFVVRHFLVDGIASADTPETAEVALMAVAKTARKDEMKVRVKKAICAGLIDAVVAAMIRFRSSADVQRSACLALANVSAEEKYREMAAESGAIDDILVAMRAHKSVVPVIVMALYALRSIACKVEFCKSRIISHGGVPAIVEAMKLHSTIAMVQEAAASALANLSANFPPGKISIADCGGIQLVIDAMFAHSGLVIQERCLAALSGLASSNVTNKAAICDLGGVERIVGAMRDNPGNAGLLRNGLLALGNIAGIEKGQRRVTDAGGVDAIIEAMTNHKSDAGIAEMGAFALKQVAIASASCEHVIAEKGGIEIVIEVMTIHSAVSLVAEECCYALANFAANNAENQKRIAEHGGVNAILVAMSAHKVPAVLKEGCRALWHTFATEEVHRRFYSAAVSDVVSKVAAENPDFREAKLCLDSVTRTEHPAATKAREQGCCILAHAPYCTKKICDARDGFFCEQASIFSSLSHNTSQQGIECCIAQKIFRCFNCSGRTGKFTRICEWCWLTKHAALGHEGVCLFRPGSCDRKVSPAK